MNLTKLDPYDLKHVVRCLPGPVVTLLRMNPNRACVAGGFIRACVAREEISDIDLFAPDRASANSYAAQLAVSAPRLRPGQYPATLIHRTDNALTVRGYKHAPQVVHRWTFESVLDVVPSFDFTVACAAVFFNGGEFVGVCDPRFYSDLAAKRLVYRSPIRNEDAGGSMLRVLKFYQRGYRIPLDSLAGVMARCVAGLGGTEDDLKAAITGRLVEVDPVVDPTHEAHLPSA